MPKKGIASIEKKLDWLIQTVRVEQHILRAKENADAANSELLDVTHKRLLLSIQRLTRSIVLSNKKTEVRRSKCKKALDELTRLWQLEPRDPE